MKFIEIVTRGWDDNTDTEYERSALVSIEKIISLEMRRQRIESQVTPSQVTRSSPNRSPIRPDVEYRNIPYVITQGDNYFIYNYSFEDLKRILMTNGNVRMTGGTV